MRFCLLLILTSACGFAAQAVTLDPTRPLSYQASPTASNGNFHLSSILYSEQRKVAVINQQVLAEGDKLGDIEVMEIQPRSVTIREKGKRRTLALPTNETPVKTPAHHKTQDKTQDN